MKKGKIITFTGVSGSGKSYLKRYLLENKSGFALLTSITTRQSRGQKEEREIVSEKQFEKLLAEKKIFFPNKLFSGCMYAYKKEDLNLLEKGINLICDITYNCIEEFKKEVGPENVITVYIKPTKINRTIYAVKKRNLPKKEEIERINQIKDEISKFEGFKEKFDYVLENNYGGKKMVNGFEEIIIREDINTKNN